MRLLPLLLVLLTVGCATTKTPMEAPPAQANLYAKFYRAYVKTPPNRTGMPPRIYRGQDQESDYRRLLEDGYDILGYSSFVGGDVPSDQALEQAKTLNADIVLVYSQHANIKPVGLPSKPKSKSAPTSEDDGRNGRLITAQAPQYEYFASYWTRLPPPILGLHVKEPAANEAVAGLPVVAVIKNSPAAEAEIQAGDTLLRIGDTDMRNVDALTRATRRYAGQQVEVVFAHEADTRHKTIVLNTKSD
ncbi:uncharacterized protein NMK_1741 [Novimethylophilus kurashikiensis]|uniref:PDZ domain-containing protein n=1 Tax=Novimethylophilus kurashikiensis TaxID=1825523 RepID=A0A2R5F7L1_9PROT|nr:PDZ domain-containing protein [Novimethylophilus kurashikiensis]GBG14177.1 uncharacterized protein NMK_1741 [Novimethylophilus kurashikiensis]